MSNCSVQDSYVVERLPDVAYCQHLYAALVGEYVIQGSNMARRTERMKEILDIRFDDPEKEKELCMQMLSDSTDRYTEAFGRTYLGDAYHTIGQIDQALLELGKALELSEADGYDDLLFVLYNLIGIIYMYNDDEQSALDYFFNGIELSEKVDDKMMQATLLSNIAYAYRGAGAYDKAEKMTDEFYRMICDSSDNESNVELDRISYETDKIWLYLHKNELDKAWELMQHSEIQNDTGVEKYINFASYYGIKGDHEQCISYIDAAMATLDGSINKYESILYQFEIIKIAIDAGLYEKALQISHISEELMEECGNIGKWVKLTEYRIEIYEALGRTDELKRAYEKYFEYDTLYTEEKKQSAVTRVRRKMELLYEIDRKKQIEQRKVDLSDKRNMDELTGLYNRWGIKNRIEKLYSESHSLDTTLMLAIADVDFFKEYNDTYGHVAGDRCLKSVAGILRQNIGNDGILGRYGGDEFLIVMNDISHLQAQQLFSKIKSDLADKNIENIKSGVSDRVTITIGAVVTKLDAHMDFKTFMHEADMALYEVKGSSRNGYKIKNLS